MSQISPYPAQIATDVNLRDMVQYVDPINAEDYNLMRAYIRDMTTTLGVNPHGSMADLATRLAVGIKDNGIIKSPAKLVKVAKTLGDFSAIQDAIDSITDADYGNPYLVHIYPGLYEANITLKSGVHLVALDPIKTMIKGKVSFISEDEGWIHFAVPIENLDSDGFQMDSPDTTAYISCPIYSGDGIALIADSGKIICSGKLHTSAAVTVQINGANVYLDRISLFNERNNAAGHTVEITAGTLSAGFCAFQCYHADAKAVYAATAKNVKIYGSWANRDLHANITNQITNGFSFDSEVEAMI